MTVQEALQFDWTTNQDRCYQEFTEEEDPGPSYKRPFWIVPRCGPGTCSKKKFPGHVGVWSYRGESFARWRYAQHLHVHGAHKMPWLDAVEMAFDEEQTKTEVQWMPFSDRRGAREYMNQTQEAQQGASSARFPLEDPAPAQQAQRGRRQKHRSSNWRGQDRIEDMLEGMDEDLIGDDDRPGVHLVPYRRPRSSNRSDARFDNAFLRLQDVCQNVAVAMRDIPPSFRALAIAHAELIQDINRKDKQIEQLERSNWEYQRDYDDLYAENRRNPRSRRSRSPRGKGSRSRRSSSRLPRRRSLRGSSLRAPERRSRSPRGKGKSKGGRK